MIIAANFKTNHTRSSTALYIEQLNDYMIEHDIKDEVIIFPPSTALDKFEDSVVVGVQNAYPTTNGSFTGEIGLEQLSDFSIKTILIGHSERRHILGETHESIIKKFNYYQRHGFKIIYCVGEPLEVREEGEQSVIEYVMNQFDGIDINYSNLIVAYEPVWAIGTGKVATIEEIENIHSVIKNSVKRPLLYGGSVKPSNISEILKINGVDGALVGTASWDINSFKEILFISKNI